MFIPRRMSPNFAALCPQPSGGGGAATIWDSANKSSLLTLDGTNLIVSRTTDSYTQAAVRATNSFSSGKVFFRGKLLTSLLALSDKEIAFGISKNAFSATTRLGFAVGEAAVFWVGNTGGGSIRVDNAAMNDFADSSTVASGDYFDIAVDMTNLKFWARKNNTGNWNSSGTADPATNVGGFTIGSGTYYPMLGTVKHNSTCLQAYFADDGSGACPSGFSWLG